jgi:LacI family transcriptional regulator
VKKPVRLLDVAKRAGVGVGTASRVINKHPSVKEDKRQRVLKAIAEMDYQINGIARSLKANRTKTIGVLIPDIANEFYADVVRGMEDVASQQGYSYILNSTDSNTDKEMASISIMREKQVDGIMMMSHTVAPELLEYINNNSLPAVFVASSLSHPSIASVSINNRAAAYDAVCYLIQLGHTRIAMVSGPMIDKSGGIDRLNGYRDAMAESSLPIPDDYIRIGADYTYRSGYDNMLKLLQLPNPPTAVFLAGDYLAIGAIKAANHLGIHVPDGLAVVGFDNLAVSEFYAPSLSTVNQPRYLMGQEAMRLLFCQISKETPASLNVVLPHEVLKRQSSEKSKKST